MAAMKFERIEGRLTAVLTDEAEAELGVKEGDVFYIERTTHETLTVSAGRTLEERRERGRSFLKRYKTTFEELAK